jgi:hypothetical protein
MTVQNTVDFNIRRALPGLLADISPAIKDSFIAEGSNIGFGILVVRGTGDNTAILPNPVFSPIMGITIRVQDRENSEPGSNLSEYAEHDVMSVLRGGRIHVLTKITVAASDPVFYYHTADGPFLPGDLSNTDVPGFTSQYPNAFWETDTTVGQVAIVKIPL